MSESDTPTDPNTAETKPAKEPKKETLGSFLRFLLLLFIATVAVRSLLVAPFMIPSGSMLPTLQIGDYLFVSKWNYGYSRYSFPFGILQFQGRFFESVPERGDIVVFRYPGQRDDDLVKRVIGLPGDTIEVRQGVVVLNGQPVQRDRIDDFIVPVSPNSPCNAIGNTRQVNDANGQPACAYPRFRETLPGGRSYDVLDQVDNSTTRRIDDPTPFGADNVAPFQVQPGHVFVMGDNRDDSLDGRFPTNQNGVGQLPIDRIEGRAFVSFWSTDGSAQWLLPWTWFTAARWSRLGITYP